MKDRPILFSAPMVRALLDGSKTQTRRVVKPQPTEDIALPIRCELYAPITYDKHGDEQPGPEIFGAYDDSGEWGARCPYGQPGDQLWVRETWLKTNPFTTGGPHTYGYRASDEVEFPDAVWKPSIHMPRAVSRIQLEITGVRVERLQDISEADAKAEGALLSEGEPCPEPEFQSHTLGYLRLWDAINGPGSWGKNPWVWCISFRRINAS